MQDLQLCVIGDSHVHALKNAWTALAPSFAGVNVTFFATSGTGIAELFPDARHLRHRAEHIGRELLESSGSGDAIDIDQFDAFVVHGAGLGFLPVLRHALHGNWLAENGTPEEHRAIAERELPLCIESTPALRLARILIALDKPVLLSAQPLPPPPDADTDSEFWRACLDADGNARPVAGNLYVTYAYLLRQRGYLQQPAGTVTAPFFTAASGHALEQELLSEMIARAGSLPRRPVEERFDPAMSFLERFLVQEKRRARELKRNPLYAALPDRALWSKSAPNAAQAASWYRKKFSLEGLRIATAGEFVSPRLGAMLRSAGFEVIDTEPVPADFSGTSAMLHGYGCQSARMGAVHSARQMLQLFERARDEFSPGEDAWPVDGGFLDPFRPSLQPQPFASLDALREERERHLAAVRSMFEQADVLLLTLSHTEVVMSTQDGAVFPAHPGMFNAQHDAAGYRVANLSAGECVRDLLELIDKVRKVRPDARFLLAVSPLPLAVTHTPIPVLAADAYTKAVLQAACRQLSVGRPFVDYFPACELITSPLFGGRFHTPDMGGIREEGVEHLMQVFFAEHQPLTPLDDEPFTED